MTPTITARARVLLSAWRAEMHRSYVVHGVTPATYAEPDIAREIAELDEVIAALATREPEGKAVSELRRYYRGTDAMEPNAAGDWVLWDDVRAVATQRQPIVPEGWKLVPIEPTEHMKQLGQRALSPHNAVRDAWDAMLAAAPVASERDSPAAKERYTFNPTAAPECRPDLTECPLCKLAVQNALSTQPAEPKESA